MARLQVQGRASSCDSLNALRRRAAMRIDRSVALPGHRLGRRPLQSIGGEIRLALTTVNFSTTHWLLMMLLTLSEQDDLPVMSDVVIVDNGSRDGGLPLLRSLASRIPRLHLVERRYWLHHAPGMRAGVRALDRLDTGRPDAANVLLFCDPDVVFLDPSALATVAECFRDGAALVGESRRHGPDGPDIQASFFAVRREVYGRRDIYPLVHDGSPAMRHQASIQRAGLAVVNLGTNRDGLILHRGRTAVAASGQYYRHHPYSTARQRRPHFMGVPDGRARWLQVEARLAPLLDPSRQAMLVETLTERLTALGT